MGRGEILNFEFWMLDVGLWVGGGMKKLDTASELKTKGNNDNWKVKLNNIVEELKKSKPKSIILFGSRARGDFSKYSDIDIAVDIDLSFREKRKLKEKIEAISGLYSVDLVFLNEAQNNFKEKILKEGKVLYAKE